MNGKETRIRAGLEVAPSDLLFLRPVRMPIVIYPPSPMGKTLPFILAGLFNYNKG